MPDAVYRLQEDLYHPTEWAGSPWSAASQHGGPVNALMARAVEAAAMETGLQPVRLVVDLLGPVPLKPLRVEAGMPHRSRRTAQVDAALLDDERPVARASALLLAASEPGAHRPSWVEPEPSLPKPESLEGRPLLSRSPPERPPGFHFSLEVRMVPEQVAAWLTTPLDLVEGQTISAFERAVALADLTGGLTGRVSSGEQPPAADARRPSFINTDTSLHLERMPTGRWVALDKIQLSDRDGIGIAAVRLLDEQGRFGIAQQSLLAR
jgi:hypothetical protein